MARGAEWQGNLSAGELTELLDARTNTETYVAGLSKAENFIILTQGPAQNRPGTKFVKETKDSSNISRLISFEFNDQQGYALEFGDQYIAVLRDGGAVLEASKAVVSVTLGSPTTIEITGHGYTSGDEVFLNFGSGPTALSGYHTLTSTGTNTFTVPEDSTGYTAYSSGGTASRSVRVATPWLEAEIDQIQLAQSADVMYLVHPNHKPRTLTRSSATSWSLANYAPTADPFTSSNNYPACVAFYEQRIWFAATNAAPQKVWASKASDFGDMTVGTNATDAFVYTIASHRINPVKWLFPGDSLMAGTINGVFVIRASGYDEAITPTNVQIKRRISYPCGSETPEMVENITMFPGRFARKVYGVAEGSNSGATSYEGKEISVRNPEMVSAGIKQLSYQQLPIPVLWMARADGALIGVTIDFSEGVSAWHRHITDGSVESIAVVPGAEREELWLIVNRTIGGSTKRYIEILAERKDAVANPEDGYYVDCGLTYDGSATSSIAGLDHLEGEEVAILADGATHPARTVNGGSIALQRSAEVVHVGLPYTSKLCAMRLNVGALDGSAQGRKKQIYEAVIRFLRTLNGKAGISESNLETLFFRSSNDAMGSPPALFTGDKIIKLSGGHDTEGRVCVVQDSPLPMTVLGWLRRFNLHEG